MTGMTDDKLHTLRMLQVAYWLPVALCVVVVALCEGGIIVGAFPTADDGGATEFAVVTAAEIATIVLLPSALFLFRIGRVARVLRERRWTALRSLGILRIAMVGLPLVVNTVLYYGYMSVSFAYLAVMSLLLMVFIFPGEGRCEEEVGEV